MKTPQGTFQYSYDALDRVTSVTNPFGQTVAFTYDALSRRKTMIYPNGTVTSYAYDAAGRVTQVSHKRAADQGVLAFNSYGYDDNGNATSITDAEGAHGYTYDALNRLTAATHPAGTGLPVLNETFGYDAIGNRTADAQRSGYTYDAANRLVSDSSFTYTYDADGNLTSRVDLVSGSSTTYTYNSSDQLIRVDASTYTIAAYKYDMLGNRVEKSVGGVVTRYIYDGPNVLAVLDGSNNLLQLMTQGPGVDAPMIARADGTDYFYHEDALGSVTALTDSAGQKVETIQYQAFGRGVVKDAIGRVRAESIAGNFFLFAARELDLETGFYYNRARHLDVNIGRFVREDPIPNVNQYIYALNNPIRLKDPFGLYGVGNALSDLGSATVDMIGGFGNGLTLGYLRYTGLDGGYYQEDASSYIAAQALGATISTYLLFSAGLVIAGVGIAGASIIVGAGNIASKTGQGYVLTDWIRYSPKTLVSNQLVIGPGAKGASMLCAIKGGGKNPITGATLPFHYHIHKYNWYRPWIWFKQTPILK
jgi:RHS repeat-associated protein